MRERLLEVIGKLEEAGWSYDSDLLLALHSVAASASPDEIAEIFEAFK